MRTRASLYLLLAALALSTARAASAITIDGRLDASYTLLATQTTQTGAQDDVSGQIGFGLGSELDAMYGAVDGGVLYLFLPGNLTDTLCGTQACTDADLLFVFIDSQSGGQNQLLGPDPPTPGLTGLTFDSGFAPDYAIEFFSTGALSNSYSRSAYFGTLPTGGGGTWTYLGAGSNAGAPGTLSGGTNPSGIQATIDNSNAGGVTAGCAAGSGAGVASGVELAIPLTAIGNPASCISVSAVILAPRLNTVTNQVMGPAPAGTCNLGVPSAVNFASIAGNQYVAFCFGAVPIRSSSWGALKTIYR